METNLRQAKTRATAVGLLTDKKLEIKRDDKTGEKHIEGSVTVKTSDINFVTFNLYSKEKKNDGSDNKTYAGLVTVMNEYNSVADVGEENANYVRVNGQLNPYRGQNGNEIIGFRGIFFNRIKQVANLETEAGFEVEMFIQAIVPEVDKDGEDTGRLIVKGWVPTYAGIEPVELIAPADVADALTDNYEPGQTAEFYGDIVNHRIEQKVEKPVAFGKPKVEIRSTYINEMVITGGSEPYEDEEGDHVPYNVDTIKAAIQERENEIAAKKAGGKTAGTGARGNNRPSGKAHGRTLKLDI